MFLIIFFIFIFHFFLLLSFAKTNKNYLPANMDDDNEYYERFLWYDWQMKGI